MQILRETTGLTSAPWAHIIAVREGLWRVCDARGRVRGHVRLIRTADGDRYRAERFQVATGRFVPLGEFWSPDDALDCLRYLR